MDSILIVDDNPENLKVLSNMLKHEGYEIRVAKNGKKALASIEAAPPELVLLDIQMPVMDGYEVCRRLKNEEKYKNIPILFISAMTESFNKVMAFKAGGDDYMTKPFDVEEVCARVRTHIKMYGYQKQLKDRNVELLQQFKSTFEQAAVGIAHIDQESLKFIKVNQWFTEILGYSNEALLNKRVDEITHPDYIEEYRLDMQRLISMDKPSFTKEKQCIKSDGSSVWCKVTVSLVKNDNRSFSNYFVVIVEDISLQKKTQNKLVRSEERLGLAIRAAKMGIWDWDIKNNYLVWEDTQYELYGITRDNFSGAYEAWAEIVHPDDKEQAEKDVQSALQNNKPFESEFRVIWPDGTLRFLKGLGAVYKNEQDEPVRMVGVNWDITEAREMELKQQDYEKRILQAQKMEAIGTLAGGIAHDFNNILSSIIGFTELVIDQIDNESGNKDNLQEVLNAGMRAKELVKQILTFARRSDDEIKPVNVDSITKEVLKFIRSSIPRSIEIIQNVSSNSMIMGNPTQIHQVIMNLCTNAAQAMDGAGSILDVSVETVTIDNLSGEKTPGLKPGDYVEIKISDNGIGIPPGIIGSIFEPYFTTKKPGEGTGIGLAVASGIVESCGGSLTVKSRLGEGTVFKAYLPATQKNTTQGLGQKDESPEGTERILFIDDEPSIAKLGCQMLERLGYTVTAESSSLCALELFRSKPDDFDLVITDMTMPKMTGDVLIRHMKDIRNNIPAILISGFSDDISKESAREEGIKGFLNKPVVKIELAKAVRDALEN